MLSLIDQHIEAYFGNHLEAHRRRILNLFYYIFSSQSKFVSLGHKGHYYVNIHSEKLNRSVFTYRKMTDGRRTVIANYKDYLNFLNGAGIIEVNTKYRVSEYSRGYRVKFSVFRNSYTWVSLDLNSVLDIKDENYWMSRYPHLKSVIKNHYSLSIDLNKAIQYLIENTGIELKSKGKKRRFLNPKRIHRYINVLVQFSIKNYWFKESAEGRLYSSLTNLPSILRPFITLKGKRLVEIDVANCAPLLVNCLVDNHKYKSDCETGSLYNNVASSLNVTPAQAKLTICTKFLFGNRPVKSGKLFDCLVELYGIEFVTKINSLRKSLIEKGGHLARELQRIESSLMIEGLSKIEKFFVPIHDSVMVLLEDVSYILRKIKALFAQLDLLVQLHI